MYSRQIQKRVHTVHYTNLELCNMETHVVVNFIEGLILLQRDENGSYLESNILFNILGNIFIFLVIISHALRNNYSMYLTQYKDRCLYKLENKIVFQSLQTFL